MSDGDVPKWISKFFSKSKEGTDFQDQDFINKESDTINLVSIDIKRIIQLMNESGEICSICNMPLMKERGEIVYVKDDYANFESRYICRFKAERHIFGDSFDSEKNPNFCWMELVYKEESNPF